MDQEQTIWADTPSQYINLKAYIGCAGFAVLWAYGSIVFQNHLIQKQIDEGTGEPIPSSFFIFMIAGLVLPLIIALFKAWQTHSTHYTLTTQRLIISEGMFARKMDELELYRIKDYHIEQPFFYRLFGLGTILLETSDRTDPSVALRAISHPEKVRDQIREHVEERRNQGGRVREVELSN